MDMLYRVNPKNQDKISQLGFGCMRLPKKGTQIDIEKTTKLIESAIEQGVNYFDTAYIYGGSEEALGKALSNKGLRDKVKVSTKMPIILCRSGADFDKFFLRQLDRLKTDRIDYYFMHMLCDIASLERLKSFGLFEWIENKKREGKIINIGFSYHGGKIEFKNILDAYDWDFCMIQYNYMDENNQAGRDGLLYANKKGLPVFIMEPLRGGTLVNALPKLAKDVFMSANKERSLAEWSFRWLWNQKEVTMVLSGMNEFSQLDENIKTASDADVGCLAEDEFKVYKKVLEAVNRAIKIPCTGCGYCLPCPQGVDIPTCFSCYNETYSHKYSAGLGRYFLTTGTMSVNQSNASKCVKCGKCERHCPQRIEISKHLSEVSKRMEFFWFKPATAIARRVMKIKN